MRFATILILMFGAQTACADIIRFNRATTTTTSTGGATTQGGFSNGTHTFQNDVRAINTLTTTGGDIWNADFGFNRSQATVSAGATVAKMYYMKGGTPTAGTSYTGSYATDFNDLFDTPFQINVGSDNVLQQTFDSIRMWSSTMLKLVDSAALTNAGFSVVERGANDDDFRMRAITSLDAAGNPDGFSTWFTVNEGDPFESGLALDGDTSATQLSYDIYENTSSMTGPYQSFHQSNSQTIGAFAVTFDEFGLNVGESVYGYEIAVLSSSERAGIDLIPAAGVIQLDGLNGVTAVPEPESYLLLPPILLAVWYLRRRRRDACNAVRATPPAP